LLVEPTWLTSSKTQRLRRSTKQTVRCRRQSLF
jgi:hypothetical protein